MMRNSTRQDSLPTLRRATVRWLLTLALVLSAVATLSFPTQAATFNVAAWVVDVNPNDNQCSLLEALINAANNEPTHADCPDGEQNQVDVIQLPAGTYSFPASMPEGWTPLVNATTGPLRLVGAGAASTILDGSANVDGLTLFDVDGGQLTLENLTLQRFTGASTGPIQVQNNGTLTVQSAVLQGNSAPVTNGGAIWASNATVTISNSTFSSNQADEYGGAIYANDATVTISNSTFTQNSAGEGGAIATYFGDADVNISNSTFTQNTANAEGGAIAALGHYGSATFTISNSTFTQNTANVGGAISSDAYIGSATVTISNSTFSLNQALNQWYWGGGAIYAGEDATVTISDSTFTQNTAPEYGGAIFAYAANLTVSGSTFSQNQADDSGGAFYLGGTTVLRLTNSTLSGNSTATTGSGSAIGIGIATNVQVDLAFVTLADQTGSPALAAHYQSDRGQLRLRNTILANPQVNECGSLAQVTLTAGGAVLADDATCTGASVIPTLRSTLGNLANNGGPTLTHALLTGSPAIDAVPSGQCTDWNNTPVTTDQRGQQRPNPANTPCDAGAVEVASSQPTPTPTPGRVELTLQRIRLSRPAPDTLQLNFVLRNLGRDPAPATTIRVLVTDHPRRGTTTLLATLPAPALDGRSSQTLSQSLTLPQDPSARFLILIVDPDNSIPERNERNNQRTVRIPRFRP
ncbi:hypothetical protein NET03_04905 [Thermomicrobium sp. CFH 73360]|uniref:choice-of-anchor Q domain-containing protein n=1 Tax=Thermomicrobium sp. CFH 73360 TaxID=2951987 RepID=UPI002077952F|nr:choice-of-anchor Q domain-containing protein [Thermomicrobium sp. CFH 73360]MCM8745862.1 hypothetical protein [Thermomicrobium sp. CFH 73360]